MAQSSNISVTTKRLIENSCSHKDSAKKKTTFKLGYTICVSYTTQKILFYFVLGGLGILRQDLTT